MQITKSKYLNLHFVGKIFLIIVFIGALIQGLTFAYKLTTGSYILSDSEIYMIDTFHLQGKAFYNSGRKYHTPNYDFSSTNGYNFSIDENTYKGIIDKKQIADKLSHHDLMFIAYSDKQTSEIYLKSKSPIFVNILQIKIGDTKYISLEKRNNEYKGMLTRKLLLTSFLFSFVLFVYWRTGKIFA